MTYKELISNLIRHYPNKYWACDAADAIEQLVKERDAAVADIEKHCHNCKNSFLFNNGRRCPYLKECRIPECDRWEWRGVQNE